MHLKAADVLSGRVLGGRGLYCETEAIRRRRIVAGEAS
jgi:hypothetical protein